jgi:hypothetical protein
MNYSYLINFDGMIPNERGEKGERVERGDRKRMMNEGLEISI